MMTRLQIILSEDEQEALQNLAAGEMRSLREQIRFVLRQDLKRRGLLKTPSTDQATLTPDVLVASETDSTLTTTQDSTNPHCGANHAEGNG